MVDVDELEMNQLLDMQEKFMLGDEKPAASCIRPTKKKKTQAGEKRTVTFTNPEPTDSEKSADEDAQHHESADFDSSISVEPMVGSICERFVGFFEMPDRVVVPEWPVVASGHLEFDADEPTASDLPDAPDLSEFWTKAPDLSGKSVFSTYFGRIHEKKVERRKLSKFKESRQMAAVTTAVGTSIVNDVKPDVKITVTEQTSTFKSDLPRTWEDEAIRNLEVFNDSTTDRYSRLAMDAVNVSFASKLMKNTAPRQEAMVLRLFDMLKTPPANRSVAEPSDRLRNTLCDEARTFLNDIKGLYLEEIQIEQSQTTWRFADDVNPVLSGDWSLVPVRRVLDAAQQCAVVPTDDDADICRLALLWSTLLLVERPFIFHELSLAGDVYVRLAELYLMGPNVLENPIISQCVSVFLNDYLFVKGRKNLLKLRLTASVASLDAFLPLSVDSFIFEDLLKHFEEYSTGDANFSMIILAAAYLNASPSDGLALAQAIWAPGRYVVRQLTAPLAVATPILDHIDEWRRTRVAEVETQHYEAYARLLAMYTSAIRDESVTRNRNPIVHAIAACELGEFVRRHTHRDADSMKELSANCVKEFDFLVDIIRSTTAGKLVL